MDEASYVPPPPAELMSCLDAWERFLHEQSLPPLVHAAIAHAHFEAIHPFLDGNGRVGRLLITLLLVGRGVLPSPLLCLSAYFESTRDAYYAHLLGLTERGEWEEWLTYFLRVAIVDGQRFCPRNASATLSVSPWPSEDAAAPLRRPGTPLART